MSDSADILAQIDASIAQALNNIPDSETSRAAIITVCLAAAKRLAASEPKELQEFWAERFYQGDDQLAAPKNDPT